jgi:hypothetical protein
MMNSAPRLGALIFSQKRASFSTGRQIGGAPGLGFAFNAATQHAPPDGAGGHWQRLSPTWRRS